LTLFQVTPGLGHSWQLAQKKLFRNKQKHSVNLVTNRYIICEHSFFCTGLTSCGTFHPDENTNIAFRALAVASGYLSSFLVCEACPVVVFVPAGL
jgi:hypothetical protein